MPVIPSVWSHLSLSLSSVSLSLSPPSTLSLFPSRSVCFSQSLPHSLSPSLSISLSLSFTLSVYLCFSLCLSLPLSKFLHPSVSLCLSIYLPVHIFTQSPIHLSDTHPHMQTNRQAYFSR